MADKYTLWDFYQDMRRNLHKRHGAFSNYPPVDVMRIASFYEWRDRSGDVDVIRYAVRKLKAEARDVD